MKIKNLKLKISSAFVPANISCIFQIHKGKNSATTGSTGVGFTLNKGVEVKVEQSKKLEIFFNSKPVTFPTVELVVNSLCHPDRVKRVEGSSSTELKNIHERDSSTSLGMTGGNFKVSITSEFPLGCGFGISGASALASAYAINDLLGLKKSKLVLAKIAHIAEVENKTGLGDVVNQYFEGLLLKRVNSSRFIVHRIPIEGVYVYCKSFGSLETKKALSDTKMIERINKAGKKALESIQQLLKMNVIPTKSEGRMEGSSSTDDAEKRFLDYARNDKSKSYLFADIIQISKAFAIESGLLTNTQVIQTIQHIESKGGKASMIMLGNGVFSNIPFEGATKYIIS